MSKDHELPADLVAWIEASASGKVVKLTRHAARREAWIVDMDGNGDGERRYFLRIDRAAAGGRSSARGLRRETGLLQLLAEHRFPSQTILAWNDRYCAALQSFASGEADLSREPREVQHAVLMDFMEVLARLHMIDIDNLALAEFVVPRSALEHPLLEIEAVEEPGLQTVSLCKTDPLAAFGKRWLANHAPASVERTVLVQGDTGPANFLYDPAAACVTAVIDWECAHFGDPMEDLGSIWLRNFFCPSAGGDLTPYFQRYAELTGFTLDRAKIAYYRVHQLVRSLFGLGYAAAAPDWQEPVALNLAYKAIIELQAVQMMMEASGLQGGAAKMPLADPVGEGTSLHALVAKQLDSLVLPRLDDAFARFIVEGHVGLLQYLERLLRFTPQIEAIERSGLAAILNDDAGDLPAARRRLIERIESLAIEDEAPVLRHLHQMALIQAALLEPLMGPWSASAWASVEL